MQDQLENKTDKLSFLEMTRTLEPGELFGDLSCLEGNVWDSLFAFATEGEAEVLVISYDSVNALFEWVTDVWGNNELMEFLANSIPSFNSRLTSSKVKMSQMFSEKTF